MSAPKPSQLSVARSSSPTSVCTARMAPPDGHGHGMVNVGGGAIFQLHGFQGTGVIAPAGNMRLAQKLHKGKRCGWDLGVEVRRGYIHRGGSSLGFLLLPHLGGPLRLVSLRSPLLRMRSSTEY